MGGQADRKRLSHHRLGRRGWMGTAGCGERPVLAVGRERPVLTEGRERPVLTVGRGGAAEQRAAQHGQRDAAGARRASSRQTTGPPSPPRALIGQQPAHRPATASSDWAVRRRAGPLGRTRRRFPRPRRGGRGQECGRACAVPAASGSNGGQRQVLPGRRGLWRAGAGRQLRPHGAGQR